MHITGSKRMLRIRSSWQCLNFTFFLHGYRMLLCANVSNVWNAPFGLSIHTCIHIFRGWLARAHAARAIWFWRILSLCCWLLLKMLPHFAYFYTVLFHITKHNITEQIPYWHIKLCNCRSRRYTRHGCARSSTNQHLHRKISSIVFGGVVVVVVAVIHSIIIIE